MHMNLPDLIAIINFGFIGVVAGEGGICLVQGSSDCNEVLV
jgi:hypothetical protein